jgi:hypothetical protein
MHSEIPGRQLQKHPREILASALAKCKKKYPSAIISLDRIASMETSVIIAALIGLLVLAFWIRIKRLRENVRYIVEKFRENGAVSENKAKPLSYMGLRSKAKHAFLLRDGQVEALTQLIRQGIVCQATQNDENRELNFYLDEQKAPNL